MELFTGHWKTRKRTSTSVARLVLEAFVGPPPFPEAQGRHLDDVRSNNDLSNLAWGTNADNMVDKIRNGRTNMGKRWKIQNGRRVYYREGTSDAAG